jgi:uncharacterized protein YggT (Ycf19 family)
MKNMKLPSVAGYLLFLTALVLSFVEIMIGLRIILKLFGANTGAPFVTWVYETTRPLLAPFAGIFPEPTINGFFVIEFSAIFALVVYALVAYVIESTIKFIDDKRD